MVVFSPVVLLLCTLWEPCACFFNKYSAFTDQKKKKKKKISMLGRSQDSILVGAEADLSDLLYVTYKFKWGQSVVTWFESP